jgi:hypothetical protein
MDDTPMPQLSARHMYLAKWLLPILTFVGVAIWTFAKKMPHTATELVSYGFALTILACFLVYFLRRDIWCLADDVLDGGSFLIVRRGNKRDRILLADVVGIDVTHQLNATRIVLRLRAPGMLGDKLEFLPKVSHRWGGRNDIADDLAARVGRFQTTREI